jgi:endonuclease/exonuclease/phosphatase family metal-dependent hydrolase
MIWQTIAILAVTYPCLAATTSGSFSVLTYNVAGLPELLSSGNPEVNTPLISPRLAPFNVINVQEDFNYHAALYASDNHAFRSATSGGVPFGSGLNTLSSFPFNEDERVKWSQCNINDGDCLTPKGFHLLRIRAAEGVWFDLYNLHTDAGSDSGDQVARASNLQQVLDFANTWSAGMAVIVMGDTNSRYTTTSDGATLRKFASTLGAVDSWVKNTRGGTPPTLGSDALVCPFPFPVGTKQATMVACETVDKVFVRSGPALTLAPSAFTNENDRFVNSTGAPLSDHYPISTTISWTLSSSVRLGDPSGGPHGNPFNDISSLITGKSVPKITSITIHAGDRVDGISYTVIYSNSTTTSASHGGTGGTASTLTLASGEHITQMTMCDGQKDGRTRVFSLKLVTNTGRSLTGGGTTSSCATSSIPTDAGTGGAWGLVAFWGRSSDEMDRLGAIWGAAY